jgi:cytochrome oxidase Cu insertion factor (SCO1/SenC/PrrC family)
MRNARMTFAVLRHAIGRHSVCALLALALAGLLSSPAQTADERSLYGEPWSWTDDSGNRVTLSKWRGQVVFLTMAYSGCRTTCALTLHTLESIQRKHDAREHGVQIVIVSYDPHNDTPQVWAAYRQQHHLNRANWHFLSGDDASTAQLAQAIGLGNFWSADRHVMHDFRIAQLDDDGRIVKSLRWQDSPVEATR